MCRAFAEVVFYSILVFSIDCLLVVRFDLHGQALLEEWKTILVSNVDNTMGDTRFMVFSGQIFLIFQFPYWYIEISIFTPHILIPCRIFPDKIKGFEK